MCCPVFDHFNVMPNTATPMTTAEGTLAIIGLSRYLVDISAFKAERHCSSFHWLCVNWPSGNGVPDTKGD